MTAQEFKMETCSMLPFNEYAFSSSLSLEISHTTGFDSMYFLSVLDGKESEFGCEWNIPSMY